MASLHNVLAKHLANGNGEQARRACRAVAPENTLERVVQIGDALVAATYDRQSDVVRFLCATFATSTYVSTAAVAEALMAVALLPRDEHTATMLHSLLAVTLPHSLRATSRSARFLLHQAAWHGWVQGLQELCDADVVAAMFNSSDLQSALQVAARRGFTHAVRILCSPHLVAAGVHPVVAVRKILVTAAERGDCSMLATLGEVGGVWPPEPVRQALLAATASDHARAVHTLCAPPFATPVFGRHPCPLLVATKHGAAAAFDALLAVAATTCVRGPGVTASFARVMSAAIQHKRLVMLHRCFEYCAWLDSSDPLAVGKTRSQSETAWYCVLHHIARDDGPGPLQLRTMAPRGNDLARRVRLALVVLQQYPGGDTASAEALEFAIHHLHKLCHPTYYYRVVGMGLVRSLTSLRRWRLRSTLLLLRHLRAANRAIAVVAAPGRATTSWQRWRR